MVDVQNTEGEGHLFVMGRLRHVTAPELVEVLGRKLGEPELKPEARGDLTEYGMQAAAPVFLPFVAEQLTPEAIQRERDAALAVAAAALCQRARRSVAADRGSTHVGQELGKAVFEKVAYGERADLAGEFDDESLYRAARLAVRELPAR